MFTRPDVIVVGARCAGAATAMLLARAGLDVLVIEAGRRGADTLSTHALMRGGVTQLDRWGLLANVIEAGTPAITRTDFAFADGERLSVDMADAPLRAPRRTVLDEILVDAAERAGAQIRHGAIVRGLVCDDAGAVVGVHWYDKALRRSHTSFAPLVIGADGRRSLVAAEVATPVTRRAQHASAVVLGYWPGFPTDAYRWFYAESSTAGVIPTNDELTCVWAGVPATRFATEPPGDLEAYLRRRLAVAAPEVALGAARPYGPVRAYPGQRGYLRRPAGPGWALVGDAGYFKDPLTAHGITDALRDAELLARAVIATPGAGAARREALRDYELNRDALSAELFTLTDRITSHTWDFPQLRVLLRDLSRAMKPELAHLSTFDKPAAHAA